MKLIPIDAGNLKLDGGAMFGVVPKVMWQKLYPADENNLCNWSMRCLLVDTGDRKILIDTGMGNKQDAKFFSHYHPNGGNIHDSLINAGYTENDITDVIHTHLHFDHVGGSIKYNKNKQLTLTFPNAKYWVSRQQWDWAENANRREKASFLKENIMPIKELGALNIIEEETELYPGIEIRLFHGHTAGQIIPFIKYKNTTVCYMGDLLPSTAHIPMPYILAYDTRPLVTLEDKKRFYDEAVANNYVLFFEHDLYNECCTLKNTEKGVRVDKTFDLAQL
jgi:glyoxylase-like metal-dependent hydrolase (beta-lactamase superfamily II)